MISFLSLEHKNIQYVLFIHFFTSGHKIVLTWHQLHMPALSLLLALTQRVMRSYYLLVSLLVVFIQVRSPFMPSGDSVYTELLRSDGE